MINSTATSYTRGQALLCATGGLIALALSACNQPPAINPWQDDAIPASAWSTPSQQGFHADAKPAIRQRKIAPDMSIKSEEQLLADRGQIAASAAPQANDQVPHFPLYWEDPFMDKGDGDGRFAWTWVDYLHMPYGLGRFIVNTIGVPASALVHLPGTSMVSDGRVGRDHDTARGKSPNPTATSADFVNLTPSTAPTM